MSMMLMNDDADKLVIVCPMHCIAALDMQNIKSHTVSGLRSPAKV